MMSSDSKNPSSKLISETNKPSMLKEPLNKQQSADSMSNK